MSSGARLMVLALAAALAAGAVWIYQYDPHEGGPTAVMLGGLAALIAIGTLFEARYRRRKTAAGSQSRDTGEREVDHETGTILEVWYDPATGERGYVPVGLYSPKNG